MAGRRVESYKEQLTPSKGTRLCLKGDRNQRSPRYDTASDQSDVGPRLAPSARFFHMFEEIEIVFLLSQNSLLPAPFIYSTCLEQLLQKRTPPPLNPPFLTTSHFLLNFYASIRARLITRHL